MQPYIRFAVIVDIMFLLCVILTVRENYFIGLFFLRKITSQDQFELEISGACA